MATYDFDIDPRFRVPLAALGVSPTRASASLDSGRLEVRFGRWRVETPVTNIKAVTVTGPYHWWKAIGTRLSFTDRGLTFGTNTRKGVCLAFVTPVPGIDPRGLIKHTGLTVTLADPEAFAAAVRSAAGIPG